MSANLVASTTISGNLLVQGAFSNVTTLFASSLSSPYGVKGITTVAMALKIASGGYQTAVLMANGTVRTFGQNDYGQLGVNDTTNRSTPVQVWGISSSAVGVACGFYHTIVPLADGTVRAFGWNQYGQLGDNSISQRNTPVQVWGISSSATAVSGGFDHSAVLLADGTVRTFGSNSYGGLGVNDNSNRSTPVQVWGISSSATAVACARFGTVVLLADGTVRTFGNNNLGQLGVNDTTTRLTPVQVWGISSSATAISTFFYHVAVLLADGTVRTFGYNNFGQLGVNDTTSRLTPVQVWGISSSAVAVAVGRYHTSVLLADGTVRVFGRNIYGQLGVNDTTQRNTPVQMFGISSSAIAIAGGGYHTSVLLSDGTVRTVGRNNVGQLGVNDLLNRSTPVQVITVSQVNTQVKIANGHYFTAVLLADGTVRTFGQNTNGQLGVNDTTSRLTPVQVWGISSSATAIECGNYHSLVLLDNGTVRSFGNSGFGALGLNDLTDRPTPVQVWGISSSAVAVAGGLHLSGVLLADGTVRTFGYNDFGQLGVNDTTSRLTPVQVWGISSSATAIACGRVHTAVLLADGTVRTFGLNSNGQLGVNDTASRLTPVQVWGISSSAVAVACGYYHTLVLLADGTVRSFGNSAFGALGLNDSTDRMTPVQVWGISSSATAIACGLHLSSVLLANRTVQTFGFNNVGQLGVNDTTNRSTPVQVWGISSSASAVACGRLHTTVLLADGTVRTFGFNPFGQLGVNDTTSRLTPVQVTSLFSTRYKIANGGLQTAVLASDGTVRTFGYNAFGQLGVNDTTSRLTPVQVWGISSSAIGVACGFYHTVVPLADGTVRTFGFNNTGQLGVDDRTNRRTPTQVLNITSATAVAAGFYHTAIVLADGTVRTCGAGSYGSLGVNDSTSRQTPVQVWGISSSATAVACGRYSTVVLLADGTLRTFGNNNLGQLGVNDTTTRLTPVQVLNITSATMVAQTWYHVAVLLADGTVRTFGYNNVGQLGINVASGSRLTPVQVWGISSSAVAVAAGRYHTSVLLADGTVRVFGQNDRGQFGVGDVTQRNTPVQMFGISSSAIAIACGDSFTSVLLADGTTRTVGRNAEGQLGVADTVNRWIPVKVGVSGNKVAGGLYHTAVISNDGTVRTFGQNTNGQLGLGDTTNRLTPVQVTGLTSAISTSFSGDHRVVLLADGTVRTFGVNQFGQLGVNDTTRRLTPVTVLNITSATEVAGGGQHTGVILANGTVRTFGANSFGQLGVNDTTSRLTPVQVWGISSSAVSISIFGYRTAVLLADGTVRTFGLNSFGELGVNDTTQRNTPVQVWGISSSATAVACGFYHTVVLLADMTVRTFGRNAEGQLGVGDTAQRNTPVTTLNITSAVAVACGTRTTIILLADGTVRTFGQNTNGQLGVNDTTQRNTPVQVFGISSSATAIAGGQYHTAILLQDGTVRTFGNNGSGQLGVNDTTSRLTPVQVIAAGAVTALGKVAMGETHTAVVLKDGTVRTFGLNSYGSCGIGDTTSRLTPVTVLNITSATAVACGHLHTAVLLADGTVRTFGYNANGGLGVNDTTYRLTPVQVWGISSSATAVAGGRLHTAVLLVDGTVRTFGSNANGQLGVNDTTQRNTPVTVLNITSATAVACGYYHTMVLLADGTVRTFGVNTQGNLGLNDTTNRLTPVQVWGISSSATAISSIGYFSGILLADGTVRTFGGNNFGQLGINVTGGTRQTPVQVWGISSSAIAIACSRYNAVILLTDGTLRTIGRNTQGQLGVNDTTDRPTPVQVFGISSSATAVAGGFYDAAVILGDGTVRTFGYNAFGQLGVNDTTNRSTPVQVTGITTAVTPVPTTYITNATAIVTPLTSAATVPSVVAYLGNAVTPASAVYLTSASPITAWPFVQFPALILGTVGTPLYQLELSTDYARKLTTSTWTTGSDERIKSDVETANVERCVEIVQNLDLKHFKWDFADGTVVRDAHSLGWIAQELEQFFPKSVETAPAHGISDFKTVNTDQMIKVMWGALKKLRADLKARKSSDSVLSTVDDSASPAPEQSL